MLYKYSCGCIGFANGSSVQSCDADIWDDRYHLSSHVRKDLLTKERSPLSPEDESAVFNELGLLVSQGYRLREVKSIFATASVDLAKVK